MAEDVQIIGIDPSLRSTGLAYLMRDGYYWERLAFHRDIARESILTSILEEFFNPPPFGGKWIVGIEGYAYGKSASSGFTPVIEVGGVIRSAVGRWAPWVEIPPPTWKWAILGKECMVIKKGTREKNRRYIEVVCKALGFESPMFNTTDEADAFCIATYVKRLLDGSIKPKGTSIRIARQLGEALEKDYASYNRSGL